MKLNIVVFFFVLLNLGILQNKTLAQSQLWEIYTTSDQPYINVIVDRYESDSLFIKSNGSLFILHQDSIKYLLKKRESKSNFGLGLLFGAIIGGIWGSTFSSGSNGFFSGIRKGLSTLSTVLGAIIGGVLGGAIGLASGGDEKYQIEKIKSENKRKLLNKLFH